MEHKAADAGIPRPYSRVSSHVVARCVLPHQHGGKPEDRNRMIRNPGHRFSAFGNDVVLLPQIQKSRSVAVHRVYRLSSSKLLFFVNGIGVLFSLGRSNSCRKNLGACRHPLGSPSIRVESIVGTPCGI
jgi:hypothetical protein